MANFATNSLSSSSSPGRNKKSPTSFLFGFTAFASKAFSDTEPVMSPTSILDTKPISALKNPFCTVSNTPKSNQTEPNFDTKHSTRCSKFFDVEGVGLGIVDSLTDDAENHPDHGGTKKKLIVANKPENSKLVLFGSQLKIQIPTRNNTFAVDSPKSPIEFGIKTKNSQLSFLSPSNFVTKSSSGSPNLGPDTPGSTQIFNGSLSSPEMELSEDYTCVIAREGSVTKTTRIFDNCIVDSCFGDAGVSSSLSVKDENGFSVSPDGAIGYPSESFLSFCHTCRKNLGHGKDIYMYRGEKAFCSDECRHQVMLMEERLEKHGAVGSW